MKNLIYNFRTFKSYINLAIKSNLRKKVRTKAYHSPLINLIGIIVMLILLIITKEITHITGTLRGISFS